MDASLRQGVIERRHSNVLHIVEAWLLIDIAAAILALILTTLAFDTTLDLRHWLLGSVIAVTMLLVYSISDLYFRRRTRHLIEDAYYLFTAWGKVLLLILAVGYLTGSYLEFDRALILAWSLVAYLFQLAVHIGIQVGLRSLRRRGFVTRNALLVGHGDSLSNFADFLAQHPWVGIRAVGYVCNDDWATGTGKQGSNGEGNADGLKPAEVAVRRLGSMKDLGALVRTHGIDEIFVTLPMRQLDKLEAVSVNLLNCPASVSWVPGISMTGAIAARADSIADQPLIRLSDSPLRAGKYTLKRTMDLVLSAVLILLLSPLLITIAVLVKLSSPGPVFFKQLRRGLGGEPVKVWKFRTMWQRPEGELEKQATADDNRVTRVGALLRRWSLDELPQLVNVLQGQMSMVGPRPHPLWLDDEFELQIDMYRQRHRVKPGITGWAQVNGHRGETETREKMELRLQHDLYYINHWSIWLDFKILLITVPAVLFKENAY